MDTLRKSTSSTTVVPLRPLTLAGRRSLRDGRDDVAVTRERAIAAMVVVEQDIERLWTDSLSLDDQAMTETLAVVGHALRQVARLLEDGDRIG